MSEKTKTLEEETENELDELNRILKESDYDVVDTEQSTKEETVAEVASRMNEASNDAVSISQNEGPTLQNQRFVECIDIISRGSNIVAESEENIEDYEEKIIELTLSQLS